MEFNHITTPFEENKEEWGKVYPRPQMRRESFFSLSGEWKLKVRKDNTETCVGEIFVPFAPESRLSGIGHSVGEVYVYEKAFTLPEGFVKDRVLLNFGAVDQRAKVLLNGQTVGEHTGGYFPFSFDVTDELCEENLIRVEVTDELDTDICYGKQSKKRGGMWYTPISGIWQMVWLESVTENYIETIKITPTINSVKIETTGGKRDKKILLEGKEYSYSGDEIEIKIENAKLWSPENPYLYDFTLTDGEDRIESYFALRTIEVKNGHICLNGEPYFFNGVLDQGYFADGIYTPGSPEGYEYDILTMKRLGFNMLRKHIKVEPDIFYYYCDKYGMAVFQDMVNNGKYHYFSDTVLPTIGFKKQRERKPTGKQRAHFEKSMKETARMLYNHPSVVYYTIFNEGWGQFDADKMYDKMKALDETRICDTTSGWFEKKKSDVESRHIYFRPVKLKKGERPLILSEAGGYSYKIEENSFNLEKTYGYKKFTDKESFEKALEKLYIDEILPCVENGLNGVVVTQLSDVEDETNGFVTYDRRVLKVDEDFMREISKRLSEAFRVKFKEG